MSQSIINAQKSTRPSLKGYLRQWYIIDASKMPLGRIATEAARILIGKNLATYSQDTNMGGVVVIINAKQSVLTGQKPDKKTYFHHSGYMGGLKATTFKEYQIKNPKVPVYKAIKGMLPKNRQQDVRMNNLVHIFEGEHNFTGINMIQVN
jgi:large subunit ribosomal protein L13